MRRLGLACCVVGLALPGFFCTPEGAPAITMTEESLSVLVTEVEGGVMVENLSGVDCIVYVRSPEGEQQFELEAGEVITVTGITPPIEVEAVGV